MADFNAGWLFGGRYAPGAEAAGFDDRAFAPVTLPHTVVPLSWGDWDPSAWEHVWIYRKRFEAPAPTAGPARTFLHFEGVMTNATVYLGGARASHHEGGYLPWAVELTPHLTAGQNVLAVVVDGRWLEVPPSGDPRGAAAVDFLQPAGIYRDVRLEVVPEIFLADVFAKPCDVLHHPRVEIQVTIDAVCATAGLATITAELYDGERPLGVAASTAVPIAAPGMHTATLTLEGLPPIAHWSPDLPQLYEVRTRLTGPGIEAHERRTRIGFREARFEPDGFHLNGERVQLFGLNRHQLYPYLGMAAPARLQRRDAELLRRELNCNIVRCAHYPQSPHFLDACDELGLMVWQEVPGWQYVGGQGFQRRVLADVRDMVLRDRGRPSVIAWGTRLNESAHHPSLYARTRQLAHALDGTRPSTGALNFRDTNGWTEDVFAYNDYSATADLEPPLPGMPYVVSEAVGALTGAPLYRWRDGEATLALQARLHARAHEAAAADPGYAGLLAWVAIDYASLHGGRRIWRALKWPGVLDTFRVPKPGAAFYRTQVDPARAAVIIPTFSWPAEDPREAIIATNCDRLELHLGGAHLTTAIPDRRRSCYPPMVVDLSAAGRRPQAELRIDGYHGGELVASLQMSPDRSRDALTLEVDDHEIRADGVDMTRLTFRAVDAYGNPRFRADGDVTLELSGPATLIGENPFLFDDYGAAGGAFLHAAAGPGGVVTVVASHPTLGQGTVTVNAVPVVTTFPTVP